MHTLFGNSPLPRYIEVAKLLRQRIVRGQWKIGDRLPSLEELAKEFDVARVTAKQAVDQLTQEGLVSPQQGRGTFVTSLPDERRLRTVTTMGELADLYRDSQPQLLNLEEASTAPVLEEGDGKLADKYFFMRRVHSLEGQPYCLISIHVDDRIFRKAPNRMREELVIPLMMSMPDVTIARAHQSMTIGTADVEEAGLLQIPVNSPVALVRRVFNDPDDTVIYLAEVIYRGDFVRLEMVMSP
jgi:GntR family transcriptional regulator